MKKQLAFRSYHSWIWDENLFSSESKLSYLWFDEVIVELPFKNWLAGPIEYLTREGKISFFVAEDILKNTVSIQKYFPDYDVNSHHDDQRPVLSDPDYEEFIRWNIRFALDHDYLKRYNRIWDDLIDNRITDVRPVNCFNAIRYWKKLNETVQCSYVPTTFEQDVLARMNKHTENDNINFTHFKEIMKIKMPRLDTLSFDQIFELKYSPFFDSFRNKIISIKEVFSKSNNQEVLEIIEEIEQKDMKELIKLFRPNPLHSTILSIFSNLPVPILNPFSIGEGINNIIKTNRIKNDFGWLYFVDDLDHIK